MIYRDYEITVERDAIIIYSVNDDLSLDKDSTNYLDDLTWVATCNADTITDNTLDNLKTKIDKINPTTDSIKAELEELRQAIRDENISYGEISRLENLADYIEFGDVELLQWANVPEGTKN